MREIEIRIIDTNQKMDNVELDYKKALELGFKLEDEFGKFQRFKVFKKVTESGN